MHLLGRLINPTGNVGHKCRAFFGFRQPAHQNHQDERAGRIDNRRKEKGLRPKRPEPYLSTSSFNSDSEPAPRVVSFLCQAHEFRNDPRVAARGRIQEEPILNKAHDRGYRAPLGVRCRTNNGHGAEPRCEGQRYWPCWCG